MYKSIIFIVYSIIFFIFFGRKIYSDIVVSNDTRSTVLSISFLKEVDWKFVFSNILKNEFFFNDIESDSVVLVNIIKDNTNNLLQTNRITKILNECITFYINESNIINVEQLNGVYRELKIFPEDHLNSYYFAMKIANYLHADYLLYSIISVHLDKLKVELQLISVKSGEIIRKICNEI